MRGYYQLGPLLAETGDVFGLHRRFRVMTEPTLRAGAAEGASPLARLQSLLAPAHRRNPPRPPALRGPDAPGGRAALPARRSAEPHPLAGDARGRASCKAGHTKARAWPGRRFFLTSTPAVFTAPPPSASAELAAVTVASLANAVYLMGQQIGFVSNGRDAADRIREEGWRADFLTRGDARARAANRKKTPACGRSSWKPPRAKTNCAKSWPRWRGWNTPTAWISPP